MSKLKKLQKRVNKLEKTVSKLKKKKIVISQYEISQIKNEKRNSGMI